MKKKGGNSAVIRSFDLNGGSVNEGRPHSGQASLNPSEGIPGAPY